MTALDDVELNLVTCLDDFLEFKRWLGRSRSVLAVDIETSGFRWQDYDRGRLIQFGDTEGGWAMPIQDWKGALRELLRNLRRQPIVAHNARFDLHWLEIELGYTHPWNLVHDTMISASLLDPPGRKNLKGLGVRHIDPRADYGQKALDDAFVRGRWDWATVPLDLPEYWCYGVLDTVITARLHENFMPKLAQAGLMDAYELESNAARPLYDMESHGFALDRDYVEKLHTTLSDYIGPAKQWVQDYYGISATSNKELAEKLLDLGAPLVKRTPSDKNWSTDEEVLTGLSDAYPLAAAALEIRKASKIVNSYLVNFERFCSPSGMVHARIRQMKAKTHRMTITEPAMQTLGRGQLVRNSFVARPGHKLISCDFAQVEARLFADAARELGMITAILRGDDLHAFTARTALGREPTPRERNNFKGTTFTIVYGGGVEKIAVKLGISMAEAKAFLDTYYRTFPVIKKWMKEVANTGRERELREGVAYVRTSDGSILTLAPDDDRYFALTNYTIQGEAAVLFKRRLIAAWNAGLGPYMVLPVHDELILEVPEGDAEEARILLEDAMTDTETYSVPIAGVASQPADRWGACK